MPLGSGVRLGCRHQYRSKDDTGAPERRVFENAQVIATESLELTEQLGSRLRAHVTGLGERDQQRNSGRELYSQHLAATYGSAVVGPADGTLR